jgi:hypothetical protein
VKEMKLENLHVVIPHSGILIPQEIQVDALSPEFPRLMKNVDWYTNWLYDFQDILGNSQIVFPYCSLILEANRDPDNLDQSVPLKDTLGEALYKPSREPSVNLRRGLARRYLETFHKQIGNTITRGKGFMLDAHSTVTARGVGDNQIELMNYQICGPDREKAYFCPDIYIETYADEIGKRLPEIKVTVNESRYYHVYGHVCGKHSTNSTGRVRRRVPAILQETNQKLYISGDGTPDFRAIERLRRAFAGALLAMMRRVSVSGGIKCQ